MKKAAISAVLALVLFGLLLGSGHRVGFAQSPAPILDIDPLVPQEDRGVITSVLSDLEPYIRRIVDLQHVDPRRVNLVHVDANGRVYSNRLWLKLIFRPIQIQPGDRLYQDPYTGEVFALPPTLRPTPNRSQLLSRLPRTIGPSAFTQVGPSCVGDSTGPFRGVYAIRGYGWGDAQILLPGTPPIILPDTSTTPTQTNDTGYIMEGGRGVSAGDVDAGLQYSPRFNNYTLFFRLATTPETFMPFPGAVNRLVANQTVYLAFFAAGVNHIAVSVVGRDTLGNITVEFLDGAVPPSWGFESTGRNVIQKRITSIGQTPPERFDTGSYFGPVQWKMAHLCCAPPGFFKDWADSDVQLRCWHPDTTHVVTVVQNAANETVTIDLTTPSTPPPCPPTGCIMRIVGIPAVDL